MTLIWKGLYNAIGYPLVYVLLHIAALLSKKIRDAIRQRYRTVAHLDGYKKTPGRRTIWFHAASMGEFEHIKPVLKRCKETFPHCTIIVTFFSPSGYTNVKSHEHVDHILYLPFDFPGTMRRFIKRISPDAFIFAKYDIWPNAVWQSVNMSVPVFVVNASLGEKSSRYRGISRSFNQSIFKHINEIWVSSPEDMERFKRLTKNTDITITGDTKFDQVIWREQNVKRNQIIDDKIITDKRVFVAGSIWPNDWNVIIPAFDELLERYDDLIIILVPHEPTDQHIVELEEKVGFPSIRYSRVDKYLDERYIIVNRVGVLASLYGKANFAYVGGSFKQNVHNVMEPAVFGIPVFYGPVHENSFEAVELRSVGGSIVVHNSSDFLRNSMLVLQSDREYKEYSETARHYVKVNSGATDVVMDKLAQYLA